MSNIADNPIFKAFADDKKLTPLKRKKFMAYLHESGSLPDGISKEDLENAYNQYTENNNDDGGVNGSDMDAGQG